MTKSVRAIIICLVAYLCFDLMSIHVRYLSASYSAQELSVYRNIFGILPSVVMLWYTRELSIRPSDYKFCLLYTSPSPRDRTRSRMPSSA